MDKCSFFLFIDDCVKKLFENNNDYFLAIYLESLKYSDLFVFVES